MLLYIPRPFVLARRRLKLDGCPAEDCVARGRRLASFKRRFHSNGKILCRLCSWKKLPFVSPKKEVFPAVLLQLAWTKALQHSYTYIEWAAILINVGKRSGYLHLQSQSCRRHLAEQPDLLHLFKYAVIFQTPLRELKQPRRKRKRRRRRQVCAEGLGWWTWECSRTTTKEFRSVSLRI